MIHASVSRTPSGEIGEIKISVTAESILNFYALINKALNCWDNAPQELKDLGDMVTHGYVTQDHSYKPINTKNSSDYYTPQETAALMLISEELGGTKFRELMVGDRVELNKLLKAKLQNKG